MRSSHESNFAGERTRDDRISDAEISATAVVLAGKAESEIGVVWAVVAE